MTNEGPVGFAIFGRDNDSHMHHGWSTPARCSACNELLDREAINPGFKVKKRRLDFSSTYDNVAIASARLGKILTQAMVQGACLLPLPADPAFFVLRSSQVVPFDAAARGTRFEGRCSVCGQYRSVVGATPVVRRPGHPLPNGLSRTDLEFGSGDEKQPMLLVDHSTMQLLAAASLRGIEFSPICEVPPNPSLQRTSPGHSPGFGR